MYFGICNLQMLYNVYEYDIPTEAGKTYVFVRDNY